MFTGIIQAVGRIGRLEARGGDMRIAIATGKLPMAEVATGDSIAVNGVCLTVVDKSASGFQADVSGETLRLTTLGRLAVNDPVNLELALTLATRLGGHLVSGHVDGLGKVIARSVESRSVRFSIRAPEQLARYIAVKGSICVDGVSLTVNELDGAVFGLNIVPHTLAETTLDSLQPGTSVNLEVDLLARYLERLMLGEQAAPTGSVGRLTQAWLSEQGFGDGET